MVFEVGIPSEMGVAKWKWNEEEEMGVGSGNELWQ
jgi:hypothetical protein